MKVKTRPVSSCHLVDRLLIPGIIIEYARSRSQRRQTIGIMQTQEQMVGRVIESIDMSTMAVSKQATRPVVHQALDDLLTTNGLASIVYPSMSLVIPSDHTISRANRMVDENGLISSHHCWLTKTLIKWQLAQPSVHLFVLARTVYPTITGQSINGHGNPARSSVPMESIVCGGDKGPLWPGLFVHAKHSLYSICTVIHSFMYIELAGNGRNCQSDDTSARATSPWSWCSSLNSYLALPVLGCLNSFRCQCLVPCITDGTGLR